MLTSKDKQANMPTVARQPIQTLEEVIRGVPIEYRYFLEGGNGKFPAYMFWDAIRYCDNGAFDGKPFVYGPWVLRVVNKELGIGCVVTRNYRPDLRAWYWLKRQTNSIVRKTILTWRIWTNRY